jgi:hypothetical protein
MQALYREEYVTFPYFSKTVEKHQGEKMLEI